MKKLWILLAVSSMAACSMAGTKKVDQRQWLEVSCNGFADWNQCNEQAAKVCQGRYDVGTREENLVTQHRSLVYACK